MDMSAFVERIRRWGVRGSLGILDQGLFSGVNFVISVFLARLISPEEYGSFSAAFSLFLLLSIAQVALIAEPMSIFGADEYSQNRTSYLNYLLRIQWIGSFLGAGLLLLGSLFVGNDVLRTAIMGMAVALPFILYYWYLRRAFYIEMQSGMAMLTSLFYSVSVVLIIQSVYRIGYLTPVTTYLGMALSSFITSFFALRRLGLNMLGETKSAIDLDHSVVNRQLWSFGKWILLAYLAGWFTSFSLPFFITLLIDSKSAGAFRAIQNLFLPFQQFVAAITLLVLPWLSRQRSSYGDYRLFSLTRMIAAIAGLAALLYSIVMVVFRHEILSFLYASEFYTSFDDLVIYLALSTLLGSAPLILGLALRVVGEPKAILWSKVAAALFFLVAGLLIIGIFRVTGVQFVLVSTALIEASLLLFFYYRARRIAFLIPHGDS